MASLGELAAELDVDASELAFLEDATPAERSALLAAIRAAATQRDRELQEAVEGALRFIPKPLRGRVTKLLRGGRG